MAVIKLLKENPEYASILAYWSYNEWHQLRSIGFDIVVKAYNQRADNSKLPIAVTAIEEGMPAGMASLREDDLWSRKDFNPWLTSLYVVPEHRGKGIGSALIEKIKQIAVEFRFKELFLFTSADRAARLNQFYLKRGWKFLEKAPGNEGREVDVFRIALRD